MNTKPVIFKIEQGESSAIFCLAELSVARDSALLQQVLNVSDLEGDEKTDALYKSKVDLLAEWAIPWPDDYKEGGKKVKRPDGVLDNAEAVKTRFEKADVTNDWITEAAINTVRNHCTPRVSFFVGSGR